MAYLLGTPLLFSLAVLQSAVLANLGFLDGRPDLVLLAVIGWALTGRAREAMGWGLIGGLALDILSGVPLGVSAAVFVLLAYLVSLFEGRLWEAHFLMPLGATLLASLGYHLALLGVVFALGRPITLDLALSRVVLPSTFLNLILALPVVQIVGRLREALYPAGVEI